MKLPDSYADYPRFLNSLRNGPGKNPIALREIVRELARIDLYFLLRFILGRVDVEHPWIFDRCREVQRSPDGHIDLWGRAHYKSTIITYALTIQDILRSHGEGAKGRECTIGIFSLNFTRATDFVRQIKREFEQNQNLAVLFPDIVWENPRRESDTWNNSAITVKRKSNPKESTVSGFGLVDGMPTGSHFTHRVYDDVITERHCTNEEIVEKALTAWEMSLNLGITEGGKERYIGTRYHSRDVYYTIMRRKAAEPRIYPATENGKVDGKPVLLSPEELSKKYESMGPYVFSSQLLQNPLADDQQGFQREWLRYYSGAEPSNPIRILVCDPANSKKKGADYTVMAVIDKAQNKRYYLRDMVRARLNLGERWKALLALHRKWQPNFVGYEQYGMLADIDYFNEKMEDDVYHFEIESLGGQLKKEERIKRLVPVFAGGKFYLPRNGIPHRYGKQGVDLVEVFLTNEYDMFPLSYHDDMLDCISRVFDIDCGWPGGTLDDDSDWIYDKPPSAMVA